MLRCGLVLHAPQCPRVQASPLRGIWTPAPVRNATTFLNGGINDGAPSESPVSMLVAHANRAKGAQADVLVRHLAASLPPSLRQPGDSHSNALSGARDIAKLLLAAQRNEKGNRRIDVLAHLGMVRRRWRAVIWLVKHVIEHLGSKPGSGHLTAPAPWKSSWHDSISEVTLGAIELPHHEDMSGRFNNAAATLPAAETSLLPEYATAMAPEADSRTDATLLHAFLGLVWRSIGAMTVQCADGTMEPGVLEIIAYLHHRGFMPTSIYNRKPTNDATAIQQPPTLHLLSSRILTSLSDAAWRAHEKLVVEEAKAKGGAYSPLGPEVPGSVWKVNVAGLRTEIWLELILWSCLHGGWVLEGMDILALLCKQQSWKPLAWRSLIHNDADAHEDWGKISAFFSSKTQAAMELRGVGNLDVSRTVSSEVVLAYIDALLVHAGAGGVEQSVRPSAVLDPLLLLRRFLHRSTLGQSDEYWNAVVLRFVESRPEYIYSGASLVPLWQLVLPLQDAKEVERTAKLPLGVYDGSAIILGLAHQALYLRIRTGDLQGALRIFKSLQTYTDFNKRRAVQDFFTNARERLRNLSDHEERFTSNYSGFESPLHNLGLPPSIMGPFLELVTDAKAYDFGRWLLSSDDVDGPVIAEASYNEPLLAPALLRFAVETSDKDLLAKLLRLRSLAPAGSRESITTDHGILQSFFDAQVRLRRWEAAAGTLRQCIESSDATWNILNLATLARVMLTLRKNSLETKGSDDLTSASKLFSEMLRGAYNRQGNQKKRRDGDRQKTLVLALSAIDGYWAEFCKPFLDVLQQRRVHMNFSLITIAFNTLLEGVVENYGAVAARRWLGLFWPHSVRKAQAQEAARRRGDAGSHDQGQSPLRLLQTVAAQRTLIPLPNRPARTVAMYGGVQPNITTIRIILRRAIQDLKVMSPRQKTAAETGGQMDSLSAGTMRIAEGDKGEAKAIDTSPSGMVVWCVNRFRELGLRNRDINEELSAELSTAELESMQKQVPRWLERPDDDHVDVQGSNQDLDEQNDANDEVSQHDRDESNKRNAGGSQTEEHGT
ncbi:hypothetical protein BAUCODRAFT_258421 [Baudoinia panamericana UAMH 10762]|uniref:Uncharacterized protein n=1 Tax=Baudoinia panamericana (strain UAMH 10762) TaxID=717646 RepID=M2M8H8_BAUPA|nr:uncharacterized protein BAUCODRAFT_258421 [Baudoinia panamericana UAMH 10762]EMC92691.1 hypothetical protein BAUCODRAFT_258421 [Baudoinia panamericana UAMH 10762]